MNETPPFCGQDLVTFSKFYAQNVHGYASLMICIAGSVANIINIIVLTRKDMISPTNVVLTGLAIADLAVLLDYIPYTCHIYLRPSSHSIRDRYTYGWALLVLWRSNFSQVFHTISIWLTVVLAVWRYIAVAYPQKNRDWCKMENTYKAVIAGYIVCPVLCIPVFLSFDVTPTAELLDENGFQTKNDSWGTNVTVYVVTMSHAEIMQELNFVIYSVVFKLTPSVLLTILSLRLVCALIETKKRRQKLTSSLTRKNAKNVEKEKQTDRTTRMLLAVLILFLVTEVPQGILGSLTLLFGQTFFKDCYQRLGDIADILALTNSAINFALYYMMSRQFRTTFKSLLSYNADPTRKHFRLNEANNHTTTQMTHV